MYPVLLRLGPFDVTSFGLLVGVGSLAGLHIFGRELHRRDLPAGAVNAAIGGLMFGVAGAKLLWVLEHVSGEPFWSLVLSRGGMSWFGGFAGGVGAGSLFLRLARVPLVPALAAAAPALAMGQAIGRLERFPIVRRVSSLDDRRVRRSERPGFRRGTPHDIVLGAPGAHSGAFYR